MQTISPGKICFSLLIPLFLIAKAQSQTTIPSIKVNQDRIEKRINELAVFGKDSLGRGYRVAYTAGDIKGRAWFIYEMKKAGLQVSIDAAGNIIGNRKGKNSSLKPLAFGSHIDMVPDGGNYDGCVGSIGALEVIEMLNQNNIITEHPLRVYIFSNEEGGTFGSAALAGNLSAGGLKITSQSGVSIGNGIKAIGGDPAKIAFVKMNRGDLEAFVELHIEQGGLLEKQQLQIGVVEGIVGIEHWMVTVEGFANHAGTTPMNLRQDALLAAAKFIVAVNEVANSYKGRQVATVGKLTVQPGAYNVIPGKVQLGLEIRDLSYDKVWQMFRDMETKATDIGTASGTKFSFQYQDAASKPALTDKNIQSAIEASVKALGYTYQYMQSGAGHDAQEMALVAPVGMIFVPSVGGISHSPKEFTTAKDMANGANVLLQTILMLDKK